MCACACAFACVVHELGFCHVVMCFHWGFMGCVVIGDGSVLPEVVVVEVVVSGCCQKKLSLLWCCHNVHIFAAFVYYFDCAWVSQCSRFV